MKAKSRMTKKMFSNYIFDKDLVSRIYEKFLRLQNKILITQ